MLNPADQDKETVSIGFDTAFYERDRFNRPGEFVQRRFKSPLHFVHNLFDLLAYTPDLARVYFGRTITARLREMIMLTVASSNDCHA